jgi:hypothetical protein
MRAAEQEDIVDAEVIEPPATRKDRARRLLLQAAVLTQLGKQDAKTREAARGEYTAGDREAASAEGVPLGAVRMDAGRVTVRVSDPAAALAWAEVNHPEQIDEVVVPTVTPEGFAWLREHHPEWITEVVAHREVYPAFLNGLVAGVKKAKGGWIKAGAPPELVPWTDPATGEDRTDRPDWIAYSQGDPILVVTPSDEASEVAVRLLAGRLPELEA